MFALIVSVLLSSASSSAAWQTMVWPEPPAIGNCAFAACAPDPCTARKGDRNGNGTLEPTVLTKGAAGTHAVALSPRNVLEFDRARAAANEAVSVRGIVTFASGIHTNRFVVAPAENAKRAGLLVYAEAGAVRPNPGDIVELEGVTVWKHQHPELKAHRVDTVRNETLIAAPGAKQADFRRGLLNGRRISLKGTVREVRTELWDARPATRLLLYLDNYSAVVRVPGVADSESLLGEPMRIEGVAWNVYGKDGKFLDSELEVADVRDMTMLRVEQVPRILLFISVLLGGALLVAACAFFVLWLRGRRERRLMAAVDAERRRMAADLHDTIEQHLAGANLLAASVLAADGVTPEIAEVMRNLAAVLANAKAEVRRVVLNLRAAGQEERSLRAELEDICRGFAKTGLKMRRCLRGLPETLPSAARQDLVLIVREAATNAVKHGKAEHLVFASDPIAGGFVLRVLNDGVPFEFARALGPAAGHYGLCGMQERAIRNRFQIAWGRLERWTYVEIKVFPERAK